MKGNNIKENIGIKVSVIIPTIGRNTLKETIESVLNQTYKNLEIIITDDTEDQKAYQIVKPYLSDGRIKYVVNTKYMHGPAGNRNNGLDHITGEYFTFVDDDDTILPDAIEKLLKIAIQKNYEIVFGNCLDQYGRYTGKHYGVSAEVYYQDLLCGNYEGEYFELRKTQLLGKDRMIDECWGGEGILWFKLWKRAKKGFYIHDVLKKYYYEGGDSVTLRALDFNIAKRSVLNYKYPIEHFFEDFKKYCPGQILRLAVVGMVFANLSGKRSIIWWFWWKSFKASKIKSIFVLPWAILCSIFPRKFMLVLWRKLITKGIKEKVKKFLSIRR